MSDDQCTFCGGTGLDTFASDAADGAWVTFTCWVCRGSGKRWDVRAAAQRASEAIAASRPRVAD